MKKIGILFLAVGLMGLTGLAAEAAAPVSRTLEFRKEMMRKNAYLGEWQEVHGDVAFTLSFATNEVGVLAFRCTVLPFRWKSDGKGKLRLFFEDALLLKETPALTYDPKTDTIDAAFAGMKCEDKFEGILKFKSLEYSSWVEPVLTEFTKPKPVRRPDYTINRAERYAKMVESNDPELKTINDWHEIMALEEIVNRSVRWETVDLEYPRIDISRFWLLPETLEIGIAFRIGGKVPTADDNASWEGRIREDEESETCGPELKAAADGLNEFVEEIKKRMEIPGIYTIDYGNGKDAWNEGRVHFFVDKNDPKGIIPLLMDTILKKCKLPRHCIVKQVPTYEEVMKALKEGRKTE